MKRISVFLAFLCIAFLPSVCSAAVDVYVLAAPYFTVTDGISSDELSAFIYGDRSSAFTELAVSPETRDAFVSAYGMLPFYANVTVMDAGELLQYAWENDGVWAVIPFEELDPRWKVIEVDGVSPYSFDFDPEAYALSLPLPEGVESNFNPEKLTSLTLTGTTAMSRYLAYHMETDGLLVPTEEIGETLRRSDLTHISNESSFTPDCPPGNPLRREQRFCSDPSYFAVLEEVGADIIELTGNHNLDYGYDAFLYSLDMYDDAGMKVYGGGRTQEEAQEPLLIEHHGNKLAFLGCNAIGPDGIWATDEHPGAAVCDLEKMKEQIAELKADGWLPIVTFQHLEWVNYDVPALQSHDFYEIARGAAPVIISGSQAHIPQGMTFVGETFIHFGLGNLFFDQMSDVERTSFFDRHYFYDNRYLGSQLETITLENYSRPRFLTEDERADFLGMIFDTCTDAEVFTEEHE